MGVDECVVMTTVGDDDGVLGQFGNVGAAFQQGVILPAAVPHPQRNGGGFPGVEHKGPIIVRAPGNAELITPGVTIGPLFIFFRAGGQIVRGEGARTFQISLCWNSPLAVKPLGCIIF